MELMTAVYVWPASVVTRTDKGATKAEPIALRLNAQPLLVIKAYDDTLPASLISTLATVSVANPLTVHANHHSPAEGQTVTVTGMPVEGDEGPWVGAEVGFLVGFGVEDWPEDEELPEDEGLVVGAWVAGVDEVAEDEEP